MTSRNDRNNFRRWYTSCSFYRVMDALHNIQDNKLSHVSPDHVWHPEYSASYNTQITHALYQIDAIETTGKVCDWVHEFEDEELAVCIIVNNYDEFMTSYKGAVVTLPLKECKELLRKAYPNDAETTHTNRLNFFRGLVTIAGYDFGKGVKPLQQKNRKRGTSKRHNVHIPERVDTPVEDVYDAPVPSVGPPDTGVPALIDALLAELGPEGSEIHPNRVNALTHAFGQALRICYTVTD